MSSLEQTTPPIVMSFSGHDPSGGAGIQADLKTMSAHNVFGMSVITSITAQNTKEVTAVHDLPLSIIEAQLDAIFSDFNVEVVKTGMLSTTEIVQLVCKKITQHHGKNLVVDPVMVSKNGHHLLQDDAMHALKTDLFPMALLVTPNTHEAEMLTDMKVQTLAEARLAAKAIHKLGCQNVLIKGGHLLEKPAMDLLYDGRFFRMYPGEFIDTPNTHGTGCTYASAIASNLANGTSLPDAIEAAKRYITAAIRHSLSIGHGHGPTNHFYFLPT
ncbi:MAG: bifunctional hydroxymethylpyrimidine kinase/phosphomethylpyrimidine kinase [Nitrospirales bacterium]